MSFLTMMRALVGIQKTFSDSTFDVKTEHDGSSVILVVIPISDTNAELFRQGREMFKPRA